MHAFLHRRLERLAKDKSGVAALEFALILPVMLAIYIGTVEVTLLLSMDRKVSHVASVAGDLVTQYEVMDAVTMADIVDATEAVIGDGNASGMSMTIESFYKDSSNKVTTVGTVNINGGVSGSYDAKKLNNRVFSRESGVVVARISYSYKSPTGIFLKGTRTLEETFILKPRKSDSIPFVPVTQTYSATN